MKPIELKKNNIEINFPSVNSGWTFLNTNIEILLKPDMKYCPLKFKNYYRNNCKKHSKLDNQLIPVANFASWLKLIADHYSLITYHDEPVAFQIRVSLLAQSRFASSSCLLLID